MKIPRSFAICTVLFTLSIPAALAQQDYVSRWDAYNAFTYLHSSLINLDEYGYHTQVGVNLKKWQAIGFDFSTLSGDTVLLPSMVKPSLQKQIAAMVPPSLLSTVRVPLHSSTQTFAMGPQLNLRRFRAVTLFIHPDLGAIHETATPHPQGLLNTLLVKQLAPSGSLSDWVVFYGVGGGAELNVTKNVSIRVHLDYVRDNLFSNMLEARNSLRISIGPSFHFGENIIKH